MADLRYAHVRTSPASIDAVLQEYTEGIEHDWRVHTITYESYGSGTHVYILFEREFYHHQHRGYDAL